MRMGDADERAVEIGRYIVRSGATVRATAAVFGVSKSTVWKDQTRLRRQSPALWREVQQVLQKNKAERHRNSCVKMRCIRPTCPPKSLAQGLHRLYNVRKETVSVLPQPRRGAARQRRKGRVT